MMIRAASMTLSTADQGPLKPFLAFGPLNFDSLNLFVDGVVAVDLDGDCFDQFQLVGDLEAHKACDRRGRRVDLYTGAAPVPLVDLYLRENF
jgi:hypothetical protein